MSDKPSKGTVKEGRDPKTGRFVKGYKGGGRKEKPDWLKGKGTEALQFAYTVMQDASNKTDIRLQAARMLAEYDLGKPKQQVDVDALNIAPVVIYGSVPD